MSGVSTATVLAGASIGASLLSTGMGVIGGMQSAQAQAGQASYMAQVARNNQLIAQRNAQIALDQGEAQVTRLQLQREQIKGSQRAALAAQGGDVNVGSPVDIVGDTERASATDIATTRYNATLRAWGFGNEAAGYGASASAYGAAGSNLLSTLPYGIGSSLLGGIGTGAGRFYDVWRNTGPSIAGAESNLSGFPVGGGPQGPSGGSVA
jgi:hypothetical protein